MKDALGHAQMFTLHICFGGSRRAYALQLGELKVLPEALTHSDKHIKMAKLFLNSSKPLVATFTFVAGKVSDF